MVVVNNSFNFGTCGGEKRLMKSFKKHKSRLGGYLGGIPYYVFEPDAMDIENQPLQGGNDMTRQTGNLNQEEVDKLLGKPMRESATDPSCEKCEALKVEIKAVQRTMNVMINQAADELESVKKENSHLRATIEQMVSGG